MVPVVCTLRSDPSLILVCGPERMEPRMAKKRHKPEQIIAKLRQVKVLIGQGNSISEAVKTIAVTETAYFPLVGGVRRNED